MPYNNKVPGSKPPGGHGLLCVEFACSSRACQNTRSRNMNAGEGVSGQGWMGGWMEATQKNKYGFFVPYDLLRPLLSNKNKTNFLFIQVWSFIPDSFIRSRLSFCLTILSP